jgi:4-hydroxy-tetrahydrodipicolinate reductase
MTAPKLTVVGAAGRMGRAIIRCLQSGDLADSLTLVGAMDAAVCPQKGQDAGLVAGGVANGVLISDVLADETEVVIDFSYAAATAALAPIVAQRGIAWVIGTTGLSPVEMRAVEAAAEKAPVLMAPNMSVGVNLLLLLVEEAARALKGRGYDVEIVERHHRRKKDAPSGTALGLGAAAAKGLNWNLDEVAQHGRAGMQDGDRPVEQIGFHAVRGGDFVGDHTVLFAADGESVELSHRATNRDTFAVGSLRAAAWLQGRQPGVYGMRDVLGW